MEHQSVLGSIGVSKTATVFRIQSIAEQVAPSLLGLTDPNPIAPAMLEGARSLEFHI